jgi:hypothetical protein
LCISEVASVVTSNSPAAYHPNTIANKREFLEKTELGSYFVRRSSHTVFVELRMLLRCAKIFARDMQI